MATMRLLIVLLLLTTLAVATATPSTLACKKERRQLVNTCKAVVFGRQPSAECCERLRVTHVECVCPIITRKLAVLIDVHRAIRIIEGCGRLVPRHFRCGSITTP